MKTLKDKAKNFIMNLFNKVKRSEIVAKDYLIATLTPDAMKVLKNISALFLKKKEDNTTVIVEIFGSKNNKLRLKTMYNSIKSDDKIIEDELKSLLNTSDNASRLLAQRVYDFNSSSGTKIQHFLDFTKYFS